MLNYTECPAQVSYTYAGDSAVNVPYAVPLLPTGRPPATTITLTLKTFFIVHAEGNPLVMKCCPNTHTLASFTTAGGPLAVGAATGAGSLTLTPNPAHGRATLSGAVARALV